MNAQPTIMYKNNLTKSPMIKQELLAAGFTEKQLPDWLGSKADTTGIKSTIDTTNTTNTKKTKNTLTQRKPAGTKPLEGQVPANKQCCVCLFVCLFVMFVVSDVMEHAEVLVSYSFERTMNQR
jgi:hypothetical protein